MTRTPPNMTSPLTTGEIVYDPFTFTFFTGPYMSAVVLIPFRIAAPAGIMSSNVTLYPSGMSQVQLVRTGTGVPCRDIVLPADRSHATDPET